MSPEAGSPDLAFFICGTPRNRKGFEYLGLGPAQLPGAPAGYLDQPASQDSSLALDVDRLEIDGVSFVRYRVSRSVVPLDAEASRGNYLACGFLTSEKIGFDLLTACIQRVREAMSVVQAYLDQNGRVTGDFVLSRLGLDVGRDIFSPTHSPELEADRVLQAMYSTGAFSEGDTRVRAIFKKDTVAEPVSGAYLYARGEPVDSLRSLEADRRLIERTAGLTLDAARQVDGLLPLFEEIQRISQENVDRIRLAYPELKESASAAARSIPDLRVLSPRASARENRAVNKNTAGQERRVASDAGIGGGATSTRHRQNPNMDRRPQARLSSPSYGRSRRGYSRRSYRSWSSALKNLEMDPRRNRLLMMGLTLLALLALAAIGWGLGSTIFDRGPAKEVESTPKMRTGEAAAGIESPPDSTPLQ